MPRLLAPHPITLVRRAAQSSGQGMVLMEGLLEIAPRVLPYSRRAARLLERMGLERRSLKLSTLLAELSATPERGGARAIPGILVDKLAMALDDMFARRLPARAPALSPPLAKLLLRLEELRAAILGSARVDEVHPRIARVALDENPPAFFYSEGRGLDAVPSGMAVLLSDLSRPLSFLSVRGPMLDAESRLYALERMKDIVLEPIADEGARLLSMLSTGLVVRLAIVTGGGLRITLRDKAIAYEIGLEDEDAQAEPGQWLVLSPDRARDMVAALALRDDVTIAWASAEKLKTARAKAKDLRVRLTERRDWLGLDGGVSVDDADDVAVADVLRALREGRRYVMQAGTLVALEDALADALAPVAASDAIHAATVMTLVDAGIHVDDTPAWRAAQQSIAQARLVDGEPPAGFLATLRPYQKEGLRFLRRVVLWQTGGILADDMGLGKTLQAMALLVERKHKGPALVLAPTSVCFNWAAELARFAPPPLGLRVLRYEGPGRKRALAQALGDPSAAVFDNAGTGTLAPAASEPRARRPSAAEIDVVVASYAIAQRDADVLAGVAWGTLVLDEAQQVKNASTARHQAVSALRADARIALTGTPLENHTGELWALFHAVSPGLFGSWTEFRARFASPIEKDADVRRRRLLARAIAPFVLRRKKIDVAPELPPRTDVEERVTLDADERRAYQRIQQALLIDVLRPGAEDGDDRKLPANEKRVKILAAITKLRLVACHAQFASDIEREPAATPPGSKQRALVELLTSLRAAGHRALVFSQFVKHLEIARAAATTAGITSLQLDGSTPAKDREALVASFQAGDVDAFFLSLKAGGTGLNLVRASYVIHLDPWWNPAVEDQASDRAHRIGQTEPVTVVRLIADDTIEEEMLDLHNHKRALVDGVLAGTAVASTLSVDELVELIRHTRRSSNDDAQGPELADVENITNRRP